jgi:hypothetical protein
MMVSFDKRDAPWESMAPDGRHVIQIAHNASGIPFYRSKLWFENDKAWTQWTRLAHGLTIDAAFIEACTGVAAKAGIA